MLSKFVKELFSKTIIEIDEREVKDEKYSVEFKLNGKKYFYFSQTESGILLLNAEHNTKENWHGLEQDDEKLLFLKEGTEDYDLAALLIARNDIVRVV